MSKPTTISGWINSLRDKNLRDNIKERCIEQNGVLGLDREAKSLSSALDRAFTWKKTDEGHNYWSEYHRKFTANPSKWLLDSNFEEHIQRLQV